MAKYFLLVKVFSRAKGSRVTRAAAYRAGERIHDDRTSESYNYSDRKDVSVTPSPMDLSLSWSEAVPMMGELRVYPGR